MTEQKRKEFLKEQNHWKRFLSKGTSGGFNLTSEIKTAINERLEKINKNLTMFRVFRYDTPAYGSHVLKLKTYYANVEFISATGTNCFGKSAYHWDSVSQDNGWEKTKEAALANFQSRFSKMISDDLEAAKSRASNRKAQFSILKENIKKISKSLGAE